MPALVFNRIASCCSRSLWTSLGYLSDISLIASRTDMHILPWQKIALSFFFQQESVSWYVLIGGLNLFTFVVITDRDVLFPTNLWASASDYCYFFSSPCYSREFTGLLAWTWLAHYQLFFAHLFISWSVFCHVFLWIRLSSFSVYIPLRIFSSAI